MRRSRGFGEHCSPPAERAAHACAALVRFEREAGESRPSSPVQHPPIQPPAAASEASARATGAPSERRDEKVIISS